MKGAETGSILVILSLTQSDLRRLRLLNLCASLLHLVFNLIIGIGPMIALNLVLTGIDTYFLLGDRRTGILHRGKRLLAPRAWFGRRGSRSVPDCSPSGASGQRASVRYQRSLVGDA